MSPNGKIHTLFMDVSYLIIIIMIIMSLFLEDYIIIKYKYELSTPAHNPVSVWIERMF